MELGNRFVALYLIQHTEASFNYHIVNSPRVLRPDAEFFAGLNDWAALGGVRELPAYDAGYIALHLLWSHRGRKLLRDVNHYLERDLRQIAALRRLAGERRARCRSFASFVGARDVYALVGALSGVPVVVDVTQDDRSVLVDFKKWLRGVRSVLGRASGPYTQRDFAAWKKYRLLETFDLALWSEIKGVRYSDSFLAQTFWPNAHFDGIERLRKVTRPKVHEMFCDFQVVHRLYRQTELQYVHRFSV